MTRRGIALINANMKKHIDNKGNLPNLRVQAVAKELVVNGGSVANAMRKAKYSKAYAKNSHKMRKTKAFQEATMSVVDEFEQARRRAFALIKRKEAKAKYRDLTDGVDKFTKNIQLLKGKPTERYDLSGIPTDELRARIARARSARSSMGVGEEKPT